MPDENAVFVVKRYAVGDRGEGDERDGVEEEMFEVLGDAWAAAARLLTKRPRQLECHRRPAQMTERIIARQPRMNDNRRGRQRWFGLMMIGDDQFETELAGDVGFGVAANAAIDSDDHLSAAQRDLPQGVGVQAIAFFQTVWNVELDV